MDDTIDKLAHYFVSNTDLHSVLKKSSDRLGELFLQRQGNSIKSPKSILERCQHITSQHKRQQTEYRGNVSQIYALHH